ncbi:prolyl oligopeptidase family serine peptidase [candidate division WOR-3 bacterium]|nr:prolyl oligopeptidase family serine peptidase [candidate division WOR-3 bacterium]
MLFFSILLIVLPLHSSFLPSIEDTIIPQKWLYVGPFSVGAREGVIGVLDSVRGFIPKEGDKLPSILAQGGEVCWKSTKVDSLGKVNLKYENVWWDTLQDIYGIAGLIGASYAWTSFQNTRLPDVGQEGKRRAIVIAKHIGSFRLNDKVYLGAPYSRGYMRIPVVLEDGENRVFFRVSGFGDHWFSFKIIPVSSPILIIDEPTLPDIVEGKPLSSFAGITLLNTTTKRLNGVELIIGSDRDPVKSGFRKLNKPCPYFKKYKKIVNNLHPLCVKKIPIKIESNSPDKSEYSKDEIWLPVKISLNGEIYKDSLKLRVREKGESYKITFLSKIDNSVQYFSVLPPSNFKSDQEPASQSASGGGAAGRYALILTLHGASVEAQGQVDCYTPKDWAYVVAPTNRRPFGFDWQDWGRLDFLEVLEEAKKRFPIDENRIYLTGHSMGGHGVWHIGISYPDLFAAIAPSAGWTCFQLYIPWFLQKSELFSHPSQLAYRDMVLREDVVPVFLENALNLPIFVLQGGADDNVPPIQARMFVRYLKDLSASGGYEVKYMEVPEKGHWWDEEDIEGVACVDHPELMNFLKEHTRNPYPKHIIFKTTDLGLNNKSYWVKIDEQERLYQDSRIETWVKEDSIYVSTENIKGFTLTLSPKLLGFWKITFVINGKLLHRSFKVAEPFRVREISFRKKRGKFVFGDSKHKRLHKTPTLYGPIKQAYFSPFVLVYGTQADFDLNQLTYEDAWVQAWLWWRKANGSVEILPDTEVTAEIIENYNLILFGGPEVNLITRKVNSHLPIHIRDGYVWFGRQKLEEKDLAIEEIYPNPLNPEKFILLYAGSTREAEKISGFFSTLYSGAGVPDFVIYDKSVSKKGWAGAKITGFFDQNWKLNKNLFYRIGTDY